MAMCWPAIEIDNRRRPHSVLMIASQCWHFARLFWCRHSSAADWAMHCINLALVRAFVIDAPYSIGDSLTWICDEFCRHASIDDVCWHSTVCTMESCIRYSLCFRHYCWTNVRCIYSTCCRRCCRHFRVHPNEILTNVANAIDWSAEYSLNSLTLHYTDSTYPVAH